MNNQCIGIGEYLKEDYEEIRKISEDKDGLDLTWKTWKQNKENGKKRFLNQGYDIVDIIVRPMELVQYCRSRGLKINGESRANFISNKVNEL